MADKFEREIEDILKKIDDFPRRSAPQRRVSGGLARRVGGIQRGLAARLARVSISQIMLTAFGLIIFSYLFRGALGGIWIYGLVLGLILFLTAFVLSLRSGVAGAGGEPYFRGRPRSYYRPSSEPLNVRLRNWWNRQRRR